MSNAVSIDEVVYQSRPKKQGPETLLGIVFDTVSKAKRKVAREDELRRAWEAYEAAQSHLAETQTNVIAFVASPNVNELRHVYVCAEWGASVFNCVVNMQPVEVPFYFTRNVWTSKPSWTRVIRKIDISSVLFPLGTEATSAAVDPVLANAEHDAEEQRLAQDGLAAMDAAEDEADAALDDEINRHTRARLYVRD